LRYNYSIRHIELRRYLACFRPATLTLFVTEREPEDVATARRLVENLWTQPDVRLELAKPWTLRLRTCMPLTHPVRPS
jgi:hypothetical protein